MRRHSHYDAHALAPVTRTITLTLSALSSMSTLRACTANASAIAALASSMDLATSRRILRWAGHLIQVRRIQPVRVGQPSNDSDCRGCEPAVLILDEAADRELDGQRKVWKNEPAQGAGCHGPVRELSWNNIVEPLRTWTQRRSYPSALALRSAHCPATHRGRFRTSLCALSDSRDSDLALGTRIQVVHDKLELYHMAI